MTPTDGLDGLFCEHGFGDLLRDLADHAERVQAALDYDGGRLRPADIDFLESVADQLKMDDQGAPASTGRPLTEKQLEWLFDIEDRIDG